MSDTRFGHPTDVRNTFENPISDILWAYVGPRCAMWGSIAPIAPPHVALRETHIHGYTIPKVYINHFNSKYVSIIKLICVQGSIISINLDSALNDPSVWGDPEVFRPDRHLNEEGKLHRNTSYYLPFGAG